MILWSLIDKELFDEIENSEIKKIVSKINLTILIYYYYFTGELFVNLNTWDFTVMLENNTWSHFIRKEISIFSLCTLTQFVLYSYKCKMV